MSEQRIEGPCELPEWVESVGCEWAFVEELSDDHTEWWCDRPHVECPNWDPALDCRPDHRPEANS